MTRTALEAAQEFYASVHAGDFDRLFNALSEDCCIEFYGPSIIPFSGIFKGKEKCKIFFGHVANDVVIEEFSQAEFITERDMVAVTGRLQMVLKATGRLYSADYAHIITTQNGLVTRFRDFQDTAQAMHASIDLTAPIR
ncbi:MAG: nuclear transport factor 2 family protein [Alphaproteobacteria bacterium]|nr:nuclear transport factor 2 family protein [Alphaproteobacteria bacterium]MBU2083981.1 nuclear transport factor 2 family protein [Alphaproteobacteria bacterium]MBU2142645.1 nuclear transport factor 2 family protein [Alphaproteobacteria bacterium]MBU2196258.1 nuclear transport factor 2 family protein [Alphaproteobacteria bacterium]